MKSVTQKFGALLMIVFFGLSSAQAQTAQKWKIDKSHSSVNFTINHFFSSVPGKFKTFEGDFYFDRNSVKTSKFSFEIMVKSVSTDDEERDNHLQSESFFNASEYPKITFVSSKVVKKSDTDFIIHGNLTIRGTTKKVELPLKIKGVMDNPWREGSVILGLQIKTSIDRTDYGVGTGSWAATAIVSDEVLIDINFELDGKK